MNGSLQIGDPTRSVFRGTNIDGGFNGMGDEQISNPGILIVLYASDLDKKLEEVIQAGGKGFISLIQMGMSWQYGQNKFQRTQ